MKYCKSMQRCENELKKIQEVSFSHSLIATGHYHWKVFLSSSLPLRRCYMAQTGSRSLHFHTPPDLYCEMLLVCFCFPLSYYAFIDWVPFRTPNWGREQHSRQAQSWQLSCKFFWMRSHVLSTSWHFLEATVAAAVQLLQCPGEEGQKLGMWMPWKMCLPLVTAKSWYCIF